MKNFITGLLVAIVIIIVIVLVKRIIKTDESNLDNTKGDESSLNVDLNASVESSDSNGDTLPQ